MGRKNRIENATFRVTQFQPNDCVTGSSIMVQVDGINILLDLGLVQDSSKDFKQLYHMNTQKLQSIPFGDLDYIIISHAHLDHIGGLGVVGREDNRFKGDIIATELTASLGEAIMMNAQKINCSDVAKNNSIKKEKKRKYYPYYLSEDVKTVVQQIKCYNYEQKIKLSDNVTLELLPSCHMSGASMIYLTYEKGNKKKTLLFTGDFTYGQKVDRPFTKRVLDKILDVDVLICESTYGENTKQVYDSVNPIDFIEEAIYETVVENNGILWISSFAVHRATVLYYYLWEVMKRNEEIRKATFPTLFCGGQDMMYKAHKLIGMKQNECYYDEKWVNEKEIFFREPFSFITTKDGVEKFCLKGNSRKIVVSSNGMFDKGFSSIIAKKYISNKKVSILGCGYQGEGTLGRQLLDGKETVTLDGEKINVRAKFLGIIPNLSGHATHDGLVSFIKSLNQHRLKDIVLVHGEQKSKEDLKEDLESKLQGNKKVHIIGQFKTLYF